MARKLFARYRSERVTELLRVQGLALLTGSERERDVALLLQAVEMREEQLRTQSGSRQWLSQARELRARVGGGSGGGGDRVPRPRVEDASRGVRARHLADASCLDAEVLRADRPNSEARSKGVDRGAHIDRSSLQ
jgi:hypothetical protein